MKTAIMIILIISILVTVGRTFQLSVQTGITSGINKCLNIEPTEKDITEERAWNRWRRAYIVLSIITLTYAFFVL